MNPANGSARAVARYLAEIGASSHEGEDLVVALTRRAEGETIDVDGVLLQPSLIQSVPEALALENRILALHRTGDLLFVAVPSEGRPDEGLSELELLLGLQVVPVPVSELDVPGLLVKAHQLLRRRARGATAVRPAPKGASSSDGPAIGELEMPLEILKRLKQVLGESQGLLLLSGPAGSGKSTTLRALGGELRRKGLKVAALSKEHGLAALEEALKEDPDALLLDGTESPSVATRALRAATEGRRVVLALEAPDAGTASAFLADMKADPHLVSTVLRAGLHQRLLKRLCVRCRAEYREDPAALEDLRLEGLLRGVPLRRPAGCKDCNNTGIRGEIAVFEYGERGASGTLRTNYQPLVADALAKLLAGHVSLKELVEQVPYTQLLQAADRLNVKRVDSTR